MKDMVSFPLLPEKAGGVVSVATEGDVIGCLCVTRHITICEGEPYIPPMGGYDVSHLESGLFLHNFSKRTTALQYATLFLEKIAQSGGLIFYDKKKRVWTIDKIAYDCHRETMSEVCPKYYGE